MPGLQIVKEAYRYRLLFSQEKIRTMCEENGSSFEVDYNVLASKCHVLAFFLPEAPTEVLAIFDEAAKSVVLSMFPKYETISKVSSNCSFDIKSKMYLTVH